jgi:hypothetical protein
MNAPGQLLPVSEVKAKYPHGEIRAPHRAESNPVNKHVTINATSMARSNNTGKPDA